MEQGFQVLLQVFGGLALFLYGTDSLCRAVQQTYHNQMVLRR